MAYRKIIISAALARLRQAAFWQWGGIGNRISFSMTAAIVLVAMLVGGVFFWEGKNTLDAEIRSRALFVAKELAAIMAQDIITGNRSSLHEKVAPHFADNDGSLSDSALRYLIIYNQGCKMLIGGTSSEIFFHNGAHQYAFSSGSSTGREEFLLSCEPRTAKDPVFRVRQNNVYDLLYPVLSGSEQVGFIRVGIFSPRYEQKFLGIIKKSAVAFFGILLAGIAFSRIIAIGITKQLLLLSKAVDNLSQQNGDTQFPIKGSDEMSRLGHAFNRMAHTFKIRNASLSQGKRDLLILHTSGLDLMESLDVDTLLVKIAVRAEDLVRAETIALSAVNRSDRMLSYLGVFGKKSKAIQEQEIPIEAGGIYNWLVSYGSPLLIPEAEADFRLNSAQMKSLEIKSIMTVPLWSANTMTGLLTAINKKGSVSFDKHDLRLFTIFSSMAAAALQNASLFNDLKGKMNELKTAQEQLVHSTKMAAIGELSANIAHEVNNPLTSVLGYTTHLLKTLELPESQRRILGLMEQETLRVRKIIRNLLDFARQRPPWMKPGDIVQPLRETIALVQGLAGKTSVVIHEDYPSEPALVNMDHNEIKQVFINIINNALQAMPEGGELLVRLDTCSDREVLIEVADTGSGIAPEHMDKIFEPFFSTKEPGNGTGLGLSISYRIVRTHGGRIEVENKPGKGASFRIFFPLFQKPVMA